jgi:hypothetical protein
VKRIGALLLLAAAACSEPSASPRATAEAFLDAHYVRIDLEGARALVTGLALDKVDKEIALTEEHEITEETRQPRVNYKLHRGDESPSSAQFAYELTIRAPGVDPFKKLVMVTVRKGDGAWSVTNYNEGELPE